MSARCTAILVAAGSASRMQGIDKILAPLDGVPLLLRSFLALSASDSVDGIWIVTRADLIPQVTDMCSAQPKLLGILAGGATRSESVQIGLAAVQGELVAVHDAARPLVTVPLIDAAIAEAARCGAAAPAIPIHDTIKIAHDAVVSGTPDRSTLFAVQTPQVFSTSLLRTALARARAAALPLTDDCSAVEALGHCVHLTDGSVENLKVTTPIDLCLAEAIWKERETNANRSRL